MDDQPSDPDQKRPPSLIDQARHAADALVNEVQNRMPPELLSQLRAGQRRIDQRLSKLQTQLGRSATRDEVERLSRRIDELAAQMEQLMRAGGGRITRPPRRDAPGRGPRGSSTNSSGGSRGPRASNTAADKGTPRRSTRPPTKREEADGGKPPRRTPRPRPRKPPESTGS